jgi:hypothetical protein
MDILRTDVTPSSIFSLNSVLNPQDLAMQANIRTILFPANFGF